MARPTLLVAEPEPEQALSARKLLLETFKFNVITAHSIREAVEVVHLFPNVDALVLHCGIRNFDSGNLIEVVKKTLPKLPIIALTPTERGFRWADHVVHSHDPQELLDLVQRLFGDPRKIRLRRTAKEFLRDSSFEKAWPPVGMTHHSVKEFSPGRGPSTSWPPDSQSSESEKRGGHFAQDALGRGCIGCRLPQRISD